MIAAMLLVCGLSLGSAAESGCQPVAVETAARSIAACEAGVGRQIAVRVRTAVADEWISYVGCERR